MEDQLARRSYWPRNLPEQFCSCVQPRSPSSPASVLNRSHKFMSRTLAKVLSLAVLLLLCGVSVFSQTDTGQIFGTVSDPQGLAVPQAKVQIINQETLVNRDMQTDETGHYAVS